MNEKVKCGVPAFVIGMLVQDIVLLFLLLIGLLALIVIGALDLLLKLTARPEPELETALIYFPDEGRTYSATIDKNGSIHQLIEMGAIAGRLEARQQ